MRFETRRRETLLGTYLFRYHPEYAGVPLWYDRDLPYHIEGGDILVLGPTVIGIGISERTQPAAIDCIARQLLWSESRSGVEHVFAFSIPHKRSFMLRTLSWMFSVVSRSVMTW